MKIIVTGATGFLGKHLVRTLLKKKRTVIALGRNIQVLKELENSGAMIAPLDLSDTEAFDSFANKNFCEGDIVVHAAALSSPWGKYDQFIKSNVLATQNVVEACIRLNIERLIAISTPSLYIKNENRLDIRESDPLPTTFINHYAATKKMAEDVVDDGARRGLQTITLRPQAILGPEDQTILPRVLRLAKKGILVSIGQHQPKIDVTFVENVVHAIELAIETKNKHCFGEKFNITNDEPVIFHDFLSSIFKDLNLTFDQLRLSNVMAETLVKLCELSWKFLPLRGEPPLTEYNLNILKYDRTLNIEKAKRLLGYSPVVSVKQGTHQLIEWIKESGALR